MFAGQRIEVDIQDTDRYGRTVGTVYRKGENINLALVRGMAGPGGTNAMPATRKNWLRRNVRPKRHAVACGRTAVPSRPGSGDGCTDALFTPATGRRH